MGQPMNATLPHRVFVYGTLKRGEPNHHYMLNGKPGRYQWVGEARTMDKYPLVIGTKQNLPFLLVKPGVGYQVKGEVYEVDDAMLALLDEFETHPTFYRREECLIEMLSENGDRATELTKAWIYFYPDRKNLFENQFEEMPMLKVYNSEGDHGRPYDTSENTECDEDLCI